MNISIGVLILFFEKTNQTIDCIKSFASKSKIVKIHILNNGSTINNWNYLKKKTAHIPNIHYHSSDYNLGPAKGRNLLISKSTEEWLFLVDNDITIKEKEDWVTIISRFINEHPKASIVCPKLYNVYEGSYCNHPQVKIENGVVSLINNNQLTNTNYFPSGASLVRRSIFEDYGLFDTEIFAFEDFEFAIRAIVEGKNLTTEYCDKITLIHDHKYSKNPEDKKAVIERYNNKRLQDSFIRIENKHGVSFFHEWQTWTNNQIIEMTQMNFVRRQIRKIQRLFY